MLVGFSFCIALSRHVILSVVTPIRHLAQTMALVRQGQLDIEIPPAATDEIGDLTRSFARMVADLQQQTVSIHTLNQEIARRRASEESQRDTVRELNASLARIKTLSGLLPICATCKKIRDDKGYWNQLEAYLSQHAEVDFTHSICPECMQKHYPEYSTESPDDGDTVD
jgi:HAMP domain-containing protein